MPMTSLQKADGDRPSDGARLRVPHRLDRAHDLRGHAPPASHRFRKAPAPGRDVVVLAEDAPVPLGRLLGLRASCVRAASSSARIAARLSDPPTRERRRRPVVRLVLPASDRAGARTRRGGASRRGLDLRAVDARAHAARTTSRRRRAGVQRVRVLARVLVLIPVELELELIARLRGFLLHLLLAHVLRLDELELASARVGGGREDRRGVVATSA